MPADLLAAMGDYIETAPQFAAAYSVLVAREEELLYERYFRGYQPETKNDLKSATKSVVALLVGIALREGHLPDLDTPLVRWLPELDSREEPAKRTITLRHALTMTAGLEWDEWANGYRDPNLMYRVPNSIEFVCGKPVAEPPGTRFRYSTGTSQLLSAVLHRATKRDLADFAAEHLLNPLGITDFHWRRHADGTHYTGVGLTLKPRDLLRIGQLCLADGLWHGRQLVPASWMREVSRTHTARDWWEGPYGLHWWVRPHGFAASGYGGQLIYVLPAERLVAVVTAEAEGPPAQHIPLAAMDTLADRFLRPAAWDPRPTATPATPIALSIARRLVPAAGAHFDCELRMARSARSSPTVVLVNTLNLGMGSWGRVASLLTDRHPVLLYDRLGQGRSDPPPTPNTVGAMADAFQAVIAAARVTTPLLLVARGAGCFIARLAAARWPDLIAGMVLIEPLHEDQTRLNLLLPPEGRVELDRLTSLWLSPEGLGVHWLQAAGAALRSAGDPSCPTHIVTGHAPPPPAIPGWPTEAANTWRDELIADLINRLHATHTVIPAPAPRLVPGCPEEVVAAVTTFTQHFQDTP